MEINVISVKTLKEHIKKKEYKRVYLLCGNEPYLKKLYRDKLKEAVLSDSDSMNFAAFAGKGTDEKEVLAVAETMPFFSEYRFLLLENTGWFKSSTEFADAVSNLPETAVLVFVEEEVDKRNRLYKAVKEYGYVCELNSMSEGDLKLWIAGLLKRENRKITEADVLFLLEQVGTDMTRLQCETEKLVCYTMGREIITEADIREVCTVQLTGKIFAMTDAIAQGQKKRALELYNDLLALHEKPMGILFMIQRQFHYLLIVKGMKEQGTDRAAVSAAISVPPFAAQKYMAQADRFQKKELRRILEYSAELEEAVKTGQIREQIAVELLLA